MSDFRMRRFIQPVLLASAVIGSPLAESFTDVHNNRSLDGWNSYGSRQWFEDDSIASPMPNNASSGFLINNNMCGENGTLEVVLRADQWNGQKGGVVFRWTSPDSYYFVTFQPGNRYSNYLKFIKNSMDANSASAVTIASNFQADTKITLKVELNGSTFKFYIDDDLKGTVTDTSLPSGQVGYGYSGEWNDYIDFYSIKWSEHTLGPQYLILVSSQLYRTGSIMDVIAQYQQDIAQEGWLSEIITVSKTSDPYANAICRNEKELKQLISNYYVNGLKGFVLVGSPNDIPTAYWRYHEKSGNDRDPSDLYYADMDEWVDLNGDLIYETFCSIKDTEGKWVEDISKPANPNNLELYPELFFGRISTDGSVTSVVDQAAIIGAYFSKLHNYRVNGSSLTQEEQNRALYLINDCYSAGIHCPINVQSVAPNLNILAGYSLLYPERITAELKKGYTYAQIITHSGSDAHGVVSWKNEVRTDAPYTLNHVISGGSKVHQINLFACSAARFDVPNFGATYIFNTDYTLNVTGSTGGWGTWMDDSYYSDLNAGEPIGDAFRKWLIRVGRGRPKGVLHGDPVLTYPRVLNNKAPVLNTKLVGLEAKAGQLFELNLNPYDPDGDPVTIDFSGLPDDASFFNNTLYWTPQEKLIGTTDTIVVHLTDDHNNSTEQAITIYVSGFMNGTLAAENGWTVTGSGSIGTMKSDGYDTPFGVEVLPLTTNNSWVCASQTVPVKPNRQYRFSFWCNNPDTANSNKVSVGINQAGYFIPAATTEKKEFRYNSTIIKTDDQTLLTFFLNSGCAGNVTSGNVYFTLLRLVDIGNRYIGNSEFEIKSGNFAADMWSIDYWNSNTEMNQEIGAGIDNTNCVSIYHPVANDSRYIQQISGLTPGTYYILKGYIKGENIVNNENGMVGANLCINNTLFNSELLTGTFDWREVTIGFEGPESGSITLQCRLGHFGNTTTGKAWFDNLTILPE